MDLFLKIHSKVTISMNISDPVSRFLISPTSESIHSVQALSSLKDKSGWEMKWRFSNIDVHTSHQKSC